MAWRFITDLTGTLFNRSCPQSEYITIYYVFIPPLTFRNSTRSHTCTCSNQSPHAWRAKVAAAPKMLTYSEYRVPDCLFRDPSEGGLRSPRVQVLDDGGHVRLAVLLGATWLCAWGWLLLGGIAGCGRPG